MERELGRELEGNWKGTGKEDGPSFERSLLEECVLLQCTSLKEDQSKESLVLEGPREASHSLALQVKLFLGLPPLNPLRVDASYGVFLRPSELCASHDIVMVLRHDGVESVGVIWFQFTALNTVYTVWSPWVPLAPPQRYRFEVKDMPEIIETRFIQKCLVYRIENGGSTALVVP